MGNDTTPNAQMQHEINEDAVLASGLFVRKEIFEKETNTLRAKLQEVEKQHFTKLGNVLDDVSETVKGLTGVERMVSEKDGKKEREELKEYLARALSEKLGKPNEEVERFKQAFQKEKQSLQSEAEKLRNELLETRFGYEIDTGLAEITAQIQDARERESAKEIAKALFLTKVRREYDADKQRFVYKESDGTPIINANGDPSTAAEILQGFAKKYNIGAKGSATGSGAGTNKGSNKGKAPTTLNDIKAIVAAEGLVLNSREGMDRYLALRSEFKL